MSDPFAAYAKQAQTIVSAPARLLGGIKTRAEARARYAEIVADLNRCQDTVVLEAYIGSVQRDILQFHAELDWFWDGDGADFLGLRKEIERARARVDDGLDFPRWEVFEPETQDLKEQDNE